MEETQVQAPLETPAPPAVTPDPAPAAVVDAPKEGESLRETLTRNMKKDRPRVNGRFAPANPATPPANAAPATAVPELVPQTPAAPVPPRPAMPKSLRLELQPHWDAAPDELRNAIIEREAAGEKGIAPLKDKAR